MLGTDVRRRLTEAERRIDWLDQHGTRGMEALRVQMTEQAKDLGSIGQSVTDIHSILDDLRSNRTRAFIAFLLAILPIYVLLFMAVGGMHKG